MFVWQVTFAGSKGVESQVVVCRENTFISAMEALKSMGPYADCIAPISAVSVGQLWNTGELRWRNAE